MNTGVLIVTGIFPPDSGGPAKFSSEFRFWCLEKNRPTKIVTYSGQASITPKMDAEVSILRINRNEALFPRYIKMIMNIGKNSRQGFRVLAAGAFLETYVASILFRFSYIAKVPGDIVWERARNNRITELAIQDFQHIKLPVKYRIFRWLFTQSLKKASIVIVPSNGLYQLCLAWGIKERNLKLIRNSISFENYFVGSDREIEFDITTVCRLVPWKGVDELIRYCSAKGLKMAVVGDGPERDALEALSKSIAAKVRFFGVVPSQEVVDILSKSQIFALNSTYEGLPHALIEARAAGLISVAREGTGSAEGINDGIDGFLVRDNRNLEQTIDLALSTSRQSGRMGELAAQDSLLRFGRENNFQAILDLLSELN